MNEKYIAFFKRKIYVAILGIFLIVSLCGCQDITNEFRSASNENSQSYTMDNIPEYDGKPYVEIDHNKPEFTKDEITDDSFESYSSLDRLGRCGEAIASVGQDIMPTKKRGRIGMVKPTGWHLIKYDFVDGRYLYNRCHLIGYQLTGENANERNLITGTRYFNVDGMLPFEEEVANYVKETDNHVMYRVTPVYEGDDLVAKGVVMEGQSVEDDGKGVSFHVFVYNIQPRVVLDYQTGESHLSGDTASTEEVESTQSKTSKEEVRGNRRSKVYHCPGQRDYEKMSTSRQLVTFTSEEEAIKAGYRKATH